MTQVSLLRSNVANYPALPPFHPPTVFPEMERLGIRHTDPQNHVYRAVRDMFDFLGLDQENCGTPLWNPLRHYIHPGDKVVLKPNLVLHAFGPQKGANCLTTHASVIRAVLDYVYLATGPEGTITIADAPLQGADFTTILRDTGLDIIQDFYRESLHFDVRIIDLRQVHAVIDEQSSLIRCIEDLPGDPKGYEEIDLAQQSRLTEIDGGPSRYVVGDYDSAITNTRHRSPHHSYVVSRTVLEADAVICIPKLKCHSKTGITVCLKNMVGIIGSKDCLPHHRQGKPEQGGDEFPQNYPARWLLSARTYALLQGRVPTSIWRLMRRMAGTCLGAGTPVNGNGNGTRRSFFYSGSWHGNDTIWRTVDDLNRILFFYDPHTKRIQPTPQRRYFAVVDGIVAMEGNGPLRGSPKATGLILGGEDPLAVDVVAATVMGYDWRHIQLLAGIAEGRQHLKYSSFHGDPSAIELTSNVAGWNSIDALRQTHYGFEPPNGWRGFVEMQHVD